MDESEYKVRIEHFRVPDIDMFIPQSMRGKPAFSGLVRYGKGLGWFPSAKENDSFKNIKPLSSGGATRCTILTEKEDDVLSIGLAICSFSDNFNYKRGREIALGRARAELERSIK